MKPTQTGKTPAPARAATKRSTSAWLPLSVAFPSPHALAFSQRVPVQRGFAERPEPPRPQLFLHKPASH